MICHNPAGERHEIADAGRKLELAFRVDWGGDDVRESHEKPLVFCSFGCLADWAREKADQHDGHVLGDGDADQG